MAYVVLLSAHVKKSKIRGFILVMIETRPGARNLCHETMRTNAHLYSMGK